jgi:hypothetical protein
LRAKTLVQERKAIYWKENLKEHFKEYYNTLKKFSITFNNVYNINKTGFQIGVLNGNIVIIYLQTKVVYLANPDNRESLIIIKTICHERQLQGLERKAKVEGSQLRLYKAKEGSRKHEAIACLNILGSPT